MDLPELKSMRDIQIQVFVALRRELDVESDIANFSRIMQNQFRRVESAIDEFDRKLFGDESKQ